MKRKNREGFSLIEVCLAIVLIAAGLLVVFSLFPAGMREGEIAQNETHAAMFADYVMSGIIAKSMSISNWNDWQAIDTFRVQVMAGLKDDGGAGIIHTDGNLKPGDTVYAGDHLKYALDIKSNSNARLIPVALWVRSGRYGATNTFKQKSKYYYTQLYYQGM